MLPPRRTKPRREQRLRCPAHLKWVRGFLCSVPGCEQEPIEAAHVRTAANSGTSLKPDDSEVVSLCWQHHREQHDHGAETFERKYDIRLAELAAEFWRRSPHRRKVA